MAELTTAETIADPCCAPEQQATCCEPSAKADCCEPSAKADCCDHDEGCDCDTEAHRDANKPFPARRPLLPRLLG